MSNQAYSVADDLMVGAGKLYFRRSTDPNGFHHLGNVDEFNITNDIEKIDKNSSMNKKRELMASVITSIKPTASITMTEYNPYNLALGLYGTEGVYHQVGATLTNESYVVPSVPGIITLHDANGNRYMDVSNVVVSLNNATPASLDGTRGNTELTQSGTNFTDIAGGGTIAVSIGSMTSTDTSPVPVYFAVTKEPTTAGDLLGMEITVKVGTLGSEQIIKCESTSTGYTGTTWTVGSGDSSIPTFVFTVDDGTTSGSATTFSKTTLSAAGLIVEGASVTYTPAVSSYKVGKDYTIDAQELRAGIIAIPENSTIKKGDTVLISATVPEKNFVTVNGGNAGDISGELLFVGDPNIGGQYNIEGWKVKITPEGDLTGLIGTEFGTFTLTVDFLSDYENHPECPYYRATLINRASGDNSEAGIYDPKY